MKISFFILTIALLTQSLLTGSVAQDYILKRRQIVKITEGKNLTFDAEVLKYENAVTGDKYTLEADDVYKIKFKQNGFVQIVQQSISLDTIACQLDSIASDVILFKQDGQFMTSVNRNEVFGIYFNENQNVSEIENYRASYFKMQNSLLDKSLQIFRRNGEVLNIIKINSIDSVQVNLTMKYGDEKLNTTLRVGDIDVISFNNSTTNQALRSNQTYLLSTSNNWRYVHKIKNIRKDTLTITIDKNNNETVEVPQKKEDVSGIFFYDYKYTTANKSGDYRIQTDAANSDLKLKLDISYGFGHLLAKSQSGSNREYIDELRTGTVLDANIKLFPITGFGVGIKYNQFKTSNSIPNLLEDNLKTSFIGLSLTADTKLKNNLGYWYVDCSVGRLSFVNDAKLLGKSIEITGSTVGVYLSTGVDFLLADNIALGFQLGLMNGSIDEMDVNGKKLELDEPESSLRIDGLIGLKIYL